MNPLLGLGSYTMGDWGAGLRITIGYGIAAGLILWEASDLIGWNWKLHRDTTFGDLGFGSGIRNTSVAGIPVIVGIGIAGLTTVLGVLEPVFYHKPGSSSKDFSVVSRIGAALLNPVFGLGSYTMGDWLGGLIMTGGMGIAVGLFAWEFALKGDDIEKYGGIPAMIGTGFAGASIIFGLIRPFFYHKPRVNPNNSNEKMAEALKGVNLAVIPDTSGIKAVRLSYNLQF
jgi:hypothetical protein